MQQLTASFGPWTVNIPSDRGEPSITDRDGNVIALVTEIGNAAIMASAKEMLDALIAVHEIVESDELPDALKFDMIEDALSLAVQKVAAESDV